MESSLSAQFRDLRGDVGHFLGYGRGADFEDTTWTRPQLDDITRCVKGGLRKFYHCDFEWSFLKPVASLTLASGENSVLLPDDFGNPAGRIIVSVAGGSLACELDFGPREPVYRGRAQASNSTGQPQCCYLNVVKGTTATRSTRAKLEFDPTADQDYALTFPYLLNPEYLSGSQPSVSGGPQHAETVLEACLSVAELIKDDAQGVHAQEFDRLLSVSKDIDRRRKPRTAGYNGDRSDGTHWGRGRKAEYVVTFDGVQYE